MERSQYVSHFARSDGVRNPVAALALRLRAVLLRGIVLVYHKQTQYLLKVGVKSFVLPPSFFHFACVQDVQLAWKSLQAINTINTASNVNINLPGQGNQ